MRGIVTLALGHPNFGKMAYVNMKSCKAWINLPFTVLASPSALAELTDEEVAEFDSIIYVPQEFYKLENQYVYYMAKAYLNVLSPYEETLFLDADTVAIKNFTELFEELISQDVLFMLHGYGDFATMKVSGKNGFWANIKDIKKYYGFEDGIIPSISSTFILFKNSITTHRFFATTQVNFRDKKVPATKWGGYFADEYFFNVAYRIVGLPLLKNYFYPVYCFWFHKDKKRDEIEREYYFFTTGGNKVDKKQRDLYNYYVVKYLGEERAQRFFHVDKAEFLAERLE